MTPAYLYSNPIESESGRVKDGDYYFLSPGAEDGLVIACGGLENCSTNYQLERNIRYYLYNNIEYYQQICMRLSMLRNDRFLPGMNYILCGKPPKSALVQLKGKAEAFKDSSLSELSDLFSNLVPSKHLEAKARKKNSRTRIYSLNVTFWAFLSQVLSPQGACLEAVRKVQSYCSKNKLPVPSSRTASYSEARGRIPVEDLNGIHKEIAKKAQGKVLCIWESTTSFYATVRQGLKKQGTPIPENDVWIAALAMEYSLSVLSNDRHFNRVQTIDRIEW